MVLSDAIVCICCLSLGGGCGLLLGLNVVYCLVLVEVHRRRELSLTGRFLPCSVDLCLNAQNIIIFFFNFFFFSLYKSWNQKICFVTLMYLSHIYD